jgi:hypothetical protein
MLAAGLNWVRLGKLLEYLLPREGKETGQSRRIRPFHGFRHLDSGGFRHVRFVVW